MGKYLGIDCSTQSMTGMVIDTELGEIVWHESVVFGELTSYGAPNGFVERDGRFFSDPLMWLEALDLLMMQLKNEFGCGEIRGISGSGQQHASVYLKAGFLEVLKNVGGDESLKDQLVDCFSRRESPIWMDNSTRLECEEIDAVCGRGYARRVSGSAMTERFTAAQIRRFMKEEPRAWGETARIHLVSSFLASVICGDDVAIDLGDGAGMNLMDVVYGMWDEGLVTATAEGLMSKLPRLEKSDSVCGEISDYFVKRYGFKSGVKVVHFTGDNPSGLIGCGGGLVGTGVISLGTSDTFFGSLARVDDMGGGRYGHVFGNPVGGWMSLICFRNGSLAREWVRDYFGLDWEEFEGLLLEGDVAGGECDVVLPFVEDEITPCVKIDELIVEGREVFESLECRSLVKRMVQCQFINMKIHAGEVKYGKIILTGGASRNDGIAQICSDVFGCDVVRLESGDSACLGAGLRAAAGVDGVGFEELFSQFCDCDGDVFKARVSEGGLLEGLTGRYLGLLERVVGL